MNKKVNEKDVVDVKEEIECPPGYFQYRHAFLKTIEPATNPPQYIMPLQILRTENAVGNSIKVQSIVSMPFGCSILMNGIEIQCAETASEIANKISEIGDWG